MKKLKKLFKKLNLRTQISLILILILLPIIGFVLFFPNRTAAWYSTGGTWNYRKTLTIDNTKVSGSVDFTDFAVLVSISSDSDLSANAQANGNDILFTSSDGTTKLDHELISYSSGTLLAYVEVPTLAYSTDTVLYMYYGNADATAQENENGTWNSDFGGVWHLEETSGSRDGATSNENTLTDNNTVTSGTGKVGTAADFELTNSETLTITDASQTGLEFAGTYTLNFWINPESLSATDGILGKGTSGEMHVVYNYNSGTGDDTWEVMHNNSTRNAHNTGAKSTATWYMVTFIFDDTNNEMTICENGSCDAAESQTNTPTNNSGAFTLGQSPFWGDLYDGLMDEVMVLNAEMTTDWVTTLYNSQNSPSTFYTVGSAEANPNTGDANDAIAHWKFDEGVDNTCSGGVNDACDSVASGVDLARTNASWQQEQYCKGGKCFYFDGTGDYLYAQDNATIDFAAASDFSIGGWFRHKPISSGTQILLTKAAGTSTTNAIEIQRNTADITNSGGTQTAPTNFTAFASLTDAFVLNINNRRMNAGSTTDSTTNEDIDDLSGTIELTATNTITFTRESASITDSNRFSWESWEYVGPDNGANEFIVRSRNTVSLSATGTSTATLDNTPTNIDNVIPFITGITCDSAADDADCGTAVAWISGTNTLNIDRAGNTENVVVQVVSVEFTGSNWQVAHGRSSDNDADTGTITLVDDADGTTAGGGDISDWSTAVIFHQLKSNDANGVDDAISDTSAVYTPNANTNQVDWTFDANHVSSTATEDHFVHVLKNSGMAVTRFQDTGSAAGANNVDITSAGISDLTTTASEISCSSSGTGVAYGRGWKNGRITSTTNYEHWAHRSGNTISCEIQIIDLSGVTAPSGSEAGYTVQMESDGDLSFIIEDGTNSDTITSTAATYDDNQWHHFTVTKDGTTDMYMYIDGVQVASDTSIATTLTLENAGPLYIGVDTDGASNDYNGFLDDIKIYDYERSAAQAKTELIGAGGTQGFSAVLGAQDYGFLNDGLVGYWAMDDDVSGDAQTITDTSGIANNGTTDYGANTTGMDCTVSGKFGFGCDFDGTDDTVDLGEDSSNFVTETGTWSFWVNPGSTPASDSGTAFLAFKETAGDYNDVLQVGYQADGKIAVRARDGSEAYPYRWSEESTNSISTGEWSHIVLVQDGVAPKLYINGELEMTVSTGGDLTAWTADVGASTLNMRVSYDTGVEYPDATMDEVRIYNRPLSESEVKQLYNWSAGPIVYYDFNENTGTTAYDRSGNATNATLNSYVSTNWAPGKFGSGYENQGTADYVSATMTSGIHDNALSIGTWVYPRSDGSGGLGFIWGDQSFTAGYCYVTNEAAGLLDVACTLLLSGGNAVLTITDGMAINEWSHLEFVWVDDADDEFDLYINGIYVGTSSGGSGTINTLTPLDIGGENSQSYPFDGVVDEFRMYNYARTPSQVIEDMNGGHPLGGSPVGSMIAHYKFDEGADNTCSGGSNDICNSGSGGSAYDGTNSATRTASGKYGDALSFNGSSEFASLGDLDDLEASTNGFTVSVWAKATNWVDAGPEMLVAKYTTGTTSGDFYLAAYQDKVRVYLYGDSSTVKVTHSANNLIDNEWNHIAATWTGVSTDPILVYVNGKLDTSTQTNNTITAFSAYSEPTLIGARNNSSKSAYFTGSIDEVKFYNTALTAAEIKVDYNANAGINFGTGTVESDNLVDASATSNLAGYWPFDENTGTTAYDVSTNANNGSLLNTTSTDWSPGKKGSSINFDADNNDVYITMANEIDFDTGLSGGFTISSWVYPRSDGEVSGTWWSVGTTSLCYTTNESAGLVDVYCGLDLGTSNATMTATDALAINTWQYVTLVYTDDSDDEITLYVDGVAHTSSTNGSGSPSTTTDDWQIGTYSGTNTFDGYIDDLKIFNTELTQSQIAYEYNRGAPIAHWKMDECTSTTINDSSGNGYTGTLTIGASGTNTSTGDCSSSTSSEAWNNGTTGKRNYSIDLDGNDDYITVTGLLGSPADISIAGWVDLDSADTGGAEIISLGDYVSLRHSVSSGYLTASFYNGSSWNVLQADSPAVDIRGDGWTHVAITFDDTNDEQKMYVNGTLVKTTGYSASITYSGLGSNTEIGRHGNGSGSYDYNGRIDDLRVYNYELSANQIKNIMNNGAVNFAPSTGAP